MPNPELNSEALLLTPEPNTHEVADSLGGALLPGAVSFGVIEETRGTKPKAMDSDLNGGSHTFLAESFVD